MTASDERLTLRRGSTTENSIPIRPSLRLSQLQTQTTVKQMSNRVDEFVFQAQRLLSQQAGRLINVEGPPGSI